MAVGGLVIFILGGQRILGNRAKVNQFDRLGDAAVLSVKIGNLVHELQKERGLTAGYLSSQGQKFSKELPVQRESTSEREKEYRSFLTSFNAAQQDETLQNALGEVNKSLSQLATKRTAIQDHQISTQDAIGYYTALNAEFLSVISGNVKLSSESEMTVKLASYVSFLQGKERAGIERAVMSSTFSRDSFAPGV